MLDPSIPLQTRLPQIQTPNELTAGAMQLRDLADTSKIRQQQIAENDLKLEQQKQAGVRQQAIQAVLQKVGQPKGGAIPVPPQMAPPTLGGLSGQGGPQAGPAPISQQSAPSSPQSAGQDAYSLDDAIEELKTVDPVAAMDLSEKVAGHQKSVLETSIKQQELGGKLLDEAARYIGMATPQNWPAVRAQIITMLPQVANMLPVEYSDEAKASALAMGVQAKDFIGKSTEALLDIQEARRIAAGGDPQTKPQEFALYTTGAAKALSLAKTQSHYAAAYQNMKMAGTPQAVLNQFPTPEAWTADTPGLVERLSMTPVERATTDRQGEQFNETKRHNRIVEGQGAQRLRQDAATSSAAIPSGIVGDEALKGVDANVARVVKQVAEYKIPLPSGFALRSPYWQNVLSLAAAYDPAFDATQYTVRLQLRKDMTSGKSANNIKSFNTAIAHLETFRKAGEALENVGFTPANAVKNYASQKMGSAQVTNFMNAANAVEAEAATAFKGTSGTDQEIKQWRANLGPNMSPEQIQGAVKTITELLAGRIAETNSQYERGMGKPKDFHFLSDKSRRILSGMNVDVDTIDPAGAPSASPASPAPAAGPQPGERRTIQGQDAEWDGTGWMPVGASAKPPQAAPSVVPAPAASPQKAQLEQQLVALAAKVQAEPDPAKKTALIEQGRALRRQYEGIK